MSTEMDTGERLGAGGKPPMRNYASGYMMERVYR